MTKGMFITFEGGDQAGKSTQIRLLAERLRAIGHDVVATFEPGEGETGQALRHLIQHAGDIGARTEALLYAADRAEHVETLIRPALARGAIVLCDRYLDSSIAYQGAARALGSNEIRQLSLWATDNLLPDLTFLIDVDPRIASARRTGTPDRLEREPLAFHQRVRSEFLALASAEPERFSVISGTESIEAIHAQIWQTVSAQLGEGS